MCRNIRVLHHFQPPTTPEEMRAAALQYVRKVSGMNKPSQDNQAAFERAVDQVTDATRLLLSLLEGRGEARTREGERERARERFARRSARPPTTGEAKPSGS